MSLSLSLYIDILNFYYLMPRLQKRLSIDLFFFKGEHSGLLETHRVDSQLRWWQELPRHVFEPLVNLEVWSCRLVFSSMVGFYSIWGFVVVIELHLCYTYDISLYLCYYPTKYRT